jgi:hypothetical protein
LLQDLNPLASQVFSDLNLRACPAFVTTCCLIPDRIEMDIAVDDDRFVQSVQNRFETPSKKPFVTTLRTADGPLLNAAVEHVIPGAWEINPGRSSHPDFCATSRSKAQEHCV